MFADTIGERPKYCRLPKQSTRIAGLRMDRNTQNGASIIKSVIVAAALPPTAVSLVSACVFLTGENELKPYHLQ